MDDLTTYFLAVVSDELHSSLSLQCWGCQMSEKSMQYSAESDTSQKWKLADGPPLLLWKQPK